MSPSGDDTSGHSQTPGTTRAKRVSGRVWAWICLVCCCTWPLASWSADLITERAWLEDPSGRLTWQAVQRLTPQPFEGVLARGYGAATVWVRLRVEPSSAGPLFLRVRPAYLDALTLYDPLQGQGPVATLGDHQPASAQADPSTVFVFRLPSGPEARDVWLRLSSTSTRLAHFEVLDENTFRRSQAFIEHAGAFYLGLMSLLILWGVVYAVLQPDGLILSFLGYQLLTLGFGAGMLGYTRLYAPAGVSPHAVDLFTNVTGISASGMVAVFSLFLLRELAPLRWRSVVMAGLMTVFPVALLLVLAGQVTAGLELNMLMVLLAPPLLWLMAWRSPPRSPAEQAERPYLPKWAILLYLGLTMGFTLLTAAPGLGWAAGSELRLYIVLFYGLSSGLLMVATLQYRSHQLLRRQSALTMEARHQREVAQQERQQRLEREQLLNMLGHELKTPLATMRMLLARPAAPEGARERLEHAVIEMSQVVERTVQTGQLDEGALQMRLAPTDLGALVRQALDGLPGASRVRLTREPGPQEDRPVRTDPYLLTVVLRNLLDNAIKYSPPTSEVLVTWAQPDASSCWQLEVLNLPGRAGWPDPARVFDKYYRSPGASHRSGSGLGLYLVRGLTQKLGGRLHYRPDDTHIRFCLSMPATETTCP